MKYLWTEDTGAGLHFWKLVNQLFFDNALVDLPKAKEMKKECTQTDYFDRTQHKEIYFSAVADELLDEKNKAWGLISARMGRGYELGSEKSKYTKCGRYKSKI